MTLGRFGPIFGQKSALPKCFKYVLSTIVSYVFFVYNTYLIVLDVPNDRMTHPLCRILPVRLDEPR